MDFHAIIVFHELLHVFHNLNGERLKVESSRPELQKHSPLLLEEARTVGLGVFSEEELSEINFVKRLEYHAEYPIRTTQLSFMMTIQ